MVEKADTNLEVNETMEVSKPDDDSTEKTQCSTQTSEHSSPTRSLCDKLTKLVRANSPESIKNALAEIIRLLKEPSARDEIAESGGIHSILDVMWRQESHASIQAACCSILACLILPWSGDPCVMDNCVNLAEADGCAPIVRAMWKYPSNKHVQREGCRALEYLSYDAKITRDIVNVDGVLALERAKTNFPDCERITRFAEQALRNVKTVDKAMEDWKPGQPAPWTEYGSTFLDPGP